MSNNKVFGIDLSVSNRDAGIQTWISEATLHDEELRIARLQTAREFLYGNPRTRPDVLNGIVEFIDESDEVVVALDMPFSLPQTLVEGDWRSFIDGVDDGHWGKLEGIDSPKELFTQAKEEKPKSTELLRETDSKWGGQIPTGWRIKEQTYYGISKLLAHLPPESVSIVPQDATDGETQLIETYPAAVFDSIDGSRIGYKQNTADGIRKRLKNLDALRDKNVVFDSNIRNYCIGTDNALDAVAAAFAAGNYLRDGIPEPLETGSEGHIFV